MARPRLTAMMALLAAVFLFAAPGCTPKTPPGTVFHAPGAAWRFFRARYCVSPSAPAVKIRASLYYSQIRPRKRTNRTLMTLWGDFGGAMRMDVSASIGTLLAHIRENGEGLLVFYPSENEAYTHVDPVLGATRLGMPFPFSLKVLAAVLAGDFSDLVPKGYAVARAVDGNNPGFVYDLDDGLVERVTLDVIGRPVLVEGTTTKSYTGARTWRLEINRYQEFEGAKPPLADKVTLALDNGEKGVLHIKSRQLMLTAWSARSLGLTLPDGVEPIHLDNGYNHEPTGDAPVVYEEK